MTFSDSFFLFEISVEDLKTGINRNEFIVKANFPDVFTVNLFPTKGDKNEGRKVKIRNQASATPPMRQSTLFPMEIDLLMKTAKAKPLCISLCKKKTENLLGETKVPWDPVIFDYLSKLLHGLNPEPAEFTVDSNVLGTDTSKVIAFMKIKVQLRCMNIANPEQNKFYQSKKLTKKVTQTVSKSNMYAKNQNVWRYSKCTQKNCRKFRSNKPRAKKVESDSHNNDETNENANNEDLDIVNDNSIESIKGNSTIDTSVMNEDKLNLLTYIFGEDTGPKENQVYCVNYFSVDNNPTDLPEEQMDLVNVMKCDNPQCENRTNPFVEQTKKPEKGIFLDLSDLKQGCCNIIEVEEIAGEMKANMTSGIDPCYCSCECTFGFTRKTTYCTVCGGYETTGEDIRKGQETFPCPIFHKLVDKNKLKTLSTSGSESKKKDDSQKSGKGSKSAVSDKRSAPDKNAESEKDSKKGKKKNKDDRFKFNYGYQAPQIGHSQCALPCTGTLGVVPKNMGWLWTAENIPGMKFRPMWKPGATNKHVVRLLRMARNPGDVITKKKKKDLGKNKRPLKRPLLVVQKKDGEYTVTMETMKQYAKPRAVNQVPYEEKPLITYTVGRTDEENRVRQKKKEREQRRLERAQRQFVQSAFKDVCREICLKTYQQALGILPDAESPDCPCFPAITDEVKANIDASCSCSEDKSTLGSDTDSDEWIIEFTPPVAYYDSGYKKKKFLKVDNSTQYTYLDYRVKLLDRYGNPVPRFFKGPDGKQQCSDLGGFWSPDHKWMDINIDGYVAPDGRWAPNAFLGPNNEQVDCDTGKFQALNGKWLVVGIDGYIDSQGKWRFYKKSRNVTSLRKSRKGDKGAIKPTYKPSEASWSCFGSASPKELSKMGILGHGQDKKLLLTTLKDMLAHGDDVKIPQPFVIPKSRLSGKRKGADGRRVQNNIYRSILERAKCRHPVPSDKGVVAMDEFGNKTYFRLKEFKNTRPEQRLVDLKDQGISLSSFHVPCFHSFINSELLKQQQLDKLLALSANSKCVHTQAG